MIDRKISDMLDALGRAQADGRLTSQLARDLDKWRSWTLRAKEVLIRISENDCTNAQREAKDIVAQLDL